MQTVRSLSDVGALALLLLLMVGLTATAAPLVPETRLLDSSPNGLVLEITVPEPRQEQLAPDGTGPEQIVLDGYIASPEGLPVQELLVGLPPNGTVEVSIEPLAPIRFVAGPAPAIRRPQAIEEQDGLVLQAGWEWQPLADDARSLPLAELTEQAFIRDWRVARLRLAPIAYLGDGRWALTPRFRVQVRFDSPAFPGARDARSLLDAQIQGMLVNGEEAASWRSAMPPVRPTTVHALPETAWRIGIAADGLYRLSYHTLAAAAVPVAGAKSDDFHLLWRGQEVALQAMDGGDGSFDPGDAFLFYGQKFHGSVQDEKYTDENAYWLTVDPSTPGQRMANRSVAPGGALPPVTWYTDTLRAEENHVYWGRWSDRPGTEATWFWERVVAPTEVTRYYPLALGALSLAPHTATLRVEVAARSENASDPDHHLRLSINDTPVGEVFWDGNVGHVMTLPFSSALLQEGANDVGVTLLTDVGVQDLYVNWVEVAYRRQTAAQGNWLTLNAPFAGDAAYTLTGFGTDQLNLYDLSDPLAPTILRDAAISSAGPTWNLEFSDEAITGRPYLALGEGQITDISTPTRYRPNLDLLSSAMGADEIMIVPDEFYASILPLAEHRRDQGLRVEVVRVEDIYPLFNGGVFHPQAIRDFLAYAYEHWQAPAPAFVLLVGDGHFNFKGYAPQTYGDPTPVYMPPYLAFVDPWQGEVPVDTLYGQIVGEDTFPDVAVGRLPANSAQEVAGAVTKIIAYETGGVPSWQDRLIFVADNVPDAGGDFEGVLDRLAAEYVPEWMRQEKVYLTDFCGPPTNPPTPCPSASQALTQTWSNGAAMLTFLGHGSVARWTHEPLLLNTQLDTLQPDHGLPFVMTLNCLDGYWMMPPKYPGLVNANSMAEWMVMAPDHGSIGNFSPAGLGTTPAEEVIARNMYDAMFNDSQSRLGELALVGQWTTVGFPAHLPQVSTLFGDPGGWLRMARARVYLPLVLRSW